LVSVWVTYIPTTVFAAHTESPRTELNRSNWQRVDRVTRGVTTIFCIDGLLSARGSRRRSSSVFTMLPLWLATNSTGGRPASPLRTASSFFTRRPANERQTTQSNHTHIAIAPAPLAQWRKRGYDTIRYDSGFQTGVRGPKGVRDGFPRGPRDDSEK